MNVFNVIGSSNDISNNHRLDYVCASLFRPFAKTGRLRKACLPQSAFLMLCPLCSALSYHRASTTATMAAVAAADAVGDFRA